MKLFEPFLYSQSFLHSRFLPILTNVDSFINIFQDATLDKNLCVGGNNFNNYTIFKLKIGLYLSFIPLFGSYIISYSLFIRRYSRYQCKMTCFVKYKTLNLTGFLLSVDRKLCISFRTATRVNSL